MERGRRDLHIEFFEIKIYFLPRMKILENVRFIIQGTINWKVGFRATLLGVSICTRSHAHRNTFNKRLRTDYYHRYNHPDNGASFSRGATIAFLSASSVQETNASSHAPSPLLIGQAL